MPSVDKLAPRVSRHRVKMQKAGLRPVRFWVPDTRKPEFAAMVKTQCQNLKADSVETTILGFTQQAASMIEGWE